MKITKLKTKYGEFGKPVSTELDAVVERMRSDDTKMAAERIRAIALHMRLMAEKGMPRYIMEDADSLPYLLFTATFGKRGFDHPNAFTQLLLLDIPCPEGMTRVKQMKKLVSQVPYTLLAFAGVSGVTLKVIVRCEYSGGATPWVSGQTKKAMQLDVTRYLAFLKEAQESAARIYTALVQCDLVVGEPSLVKGCRMSHDPELFYNPQAQPLPVIHDEDNALAPYKGTKTDDDGSVIWYPDSDEHERYKLEFYTCMKKALDENPDDMEKCLVLLAGYCQKAGLEEEACVARVLWDFRLKSMGDDMIRKVFRETYTKPYNGRTVTQMNEKGEIDMNERVPYKQMFAQAVTELKNPDCLYWFTSETVQASEGQGCTEPESPRKCYKGPPLAQNCQQRSAWLLPQTTKNQHSVARKVHDSSIIFTIVHLYILLNTNNISLKVAPGAPFSLTI